jgi:hypothetical protein
MPSNSRKHSRYTKLQVQSGHLGWVRSVAVKPGNKWFATGAGDRVIKIWNLALGELPLSLTGHISTVRGLAVSPRHPTSCSGRIATNAHVSPKMHYNKAGMTPRPAIVAIRKIEPKSRTGQCQTSEFQFCLLDMFYFRKWHMFFQKLHMFFLEIAYVFSGKMICFFLENDIDFNKDKIHFKIRSTLSNLLDVV